MMTKEKLKQILVSHDFFVEQSGLDYKFTNNIIEIASKKFGIYFLESHDDKFYLRTLRPLGLSNPLLLLIDDTNEKIRISLIEEYSNNIFCILISK